MQSAKYNEVIIIKWSGNYNKIINCDSYTTNYKRKISKNYFTFDTIIKQDFGVRCKPYVISQSQNLHTHFSYQSSDFKKKFMYNRLLNKYFSKLEVTFDNYHFAYEYLHSLLEVLILIIPKSYALFKNVVKYLILSKKFSIFF